MAQTVSTAAPDDATIAPRWIRPTRWQQLTGMSHSVTYRALWSGQLHAVRIGAQWFIPATELDSFFQRNANAASA